MSSIPTDVLSSEPLEANPVDAEAQAKTDAELLAKLKQWYADWEEATLDERKEAEKDREFYDGIQWTAKEKKDLEDRGQPALAFNHIAPKINYLLGDEILKRVDPKVFPRTPAHEDAAEAATDKLRHIDEAEDFDDLRSTVFEELLIEGVMGGVVEIEETFDLEPVAERTQVTPMIDGGMPAVEVDRVEVAKAKPRYEVRLRHAPYDRLFWDPHARRHDLGDARYLGLVTWMDREDAEAEYPDTDAVFDATFSDAQGSTSQDTHEDRPRGWADPTRNRILIAEIYWREGKDWRVAHFTGGGFCRDPQLTGYLDERGHHECQLLVDSCFITRNNRHYGVVRSMRAPQEEINKRRSKALHRLNTKEVILKRGAIAEPDSAKQEIARPDMWLELNDGFELNDLVIRTPESLTALELNMLQESKAEIENTGVMGQVLSDPNASGRAQMIRMRAASVPMEKVHDRLRSWTKRMYTAMWHRVRQFCTEEEWLRVTDDAEKKGYRFVGVNRSMTRSERLEELLQKGVPLDSALTMLGSVEAVPAFHSIIQELGMLAEQQGAQLPPPVLQQQALTMFMRTPLMQQRIVTNQLDQLDADIIIEETPDTTTIQQEEYQELVGLAQTGIQLPPQFVELVIEASSMRNKKRLLEMLRQPPSPQAQQMAAVQQAGVEAGVRKTAAQAAQAEADAAKTAAEIQFLPVKAQRDQAAAMNDAANADVANQRVRLPTQNQMMQEGRPDGRPI